jgi:hypothetical protein
MLKRPNNILLLLSLLLILSCRKESREWQVNVVAPIFQADLSLNDIVADSLLSTNGDNSYNLVYVFENTIDSFGQVLNVPDTVNENRISLQQLALADETLVDTIRLRDIAPETILLNGRTVVLPAQDIQNAGGGQEIDISENFFKKATIKSGFLDIDLHNDLPVEVEILIFKLSNKNDGVLIALDTFKNILPFQSASRSIDIGGKTIDGVLVGEMVQVKTKESVGPVLIEANKGVRVELKVRDLQVEKAIAVFPAQVLVRDTSEVRYNLGKAKVTVMHIHRGNIAVTITSTIEEAIIINYTIPTSGKDGDYNFPIKLTVEVPPAKPGTTQKYTELVPIDGYTILYKGKDPLQAPFYNTIYSELTASTVYSGIERNLSLTDSVFISFGLVDIEPAYAIGEFGDRSFGVEDTLNITGLKNLQGGISLEDATLELELSNGFGIEADFVLNSIKSINNRTKNTVPLNYYIVGNNELIHRAVNPPFRAFETRWVMNSSNSNIKPLMANLPDMISYDVELTSQPNGSRDFTDFIFDYSTFKTKLTLDLPVNFGFDSLSLVKLSDFDFSDIQNNEQIISGDFQLRVENDYPIDAHLILEFLNSDKEVLYTAFRGQKIMAATLKPGTDLTIGPELSYLRTEIDQSNMELLRDSKFIRISTMFDTPDSKNHKVYNHYTLKTKLLADFIYEQKL